MTDIEQKTIEMVLNELDTVCPYYSNDYEALHRAKKALRQVLEKFANSTTDFVESKALAQTEQEPVAWITPDGEGFRIRFSPPVNDMPLGWEPLYTAPPKQPKQEPVGTYEGVMETMLSLRKGTLEQQQIYTHMKDKLLYTAPPKREWIELTNEDIHNTKGYEEDRKMFRFAKSLLAKAKEKNA